MIASVNAGQLRVIRFIYRDGSASRSSCLSFDRDQSRTAHLSDSCISGPLSEFARCQWRPSSSRSLSWRSVYLPYPFTGPICKRAGSASRWAALPASSPPPPRIQHCPLCRVAMVASRSNEESPHFDTFACLKCGTTVTLVSPPKTKALKSDG